MSLDVYLTMKDASRAPHSGIFIREDGSTKEISRAEWDALYPDREPIVVSGDDSGEVFSANITHNLGRMARLAGIYEALWRPEEIGIVYAKDLIPRLREGIAWLEANREEAETANPPNGWGDYDGLLGFVREYLVACEGYPEATVRVSR